MEDIKNYKLLNEKFRLKYCIDRVIACALLALASPIFLMVICGVKLGGWFYPEDSGSIFYTEPRISAGEIFNIIKFRTVTMVAVEKIKNSTDTRSITCSPNTTCAGKIILKWYLDEFPQLFNIAKGDISFVGPRPHIISHHENDIKSGLIYRNIVKAGLLGIPQACKRRPGYAAMLGKMSIKHKSCNKVLDKLDGLYVKKCLKKSVFGIALFDIYIIIQGLIVIMKGGGK